MHSSTAIQNRPQDSERARTGTLFPVCWIRIGSYDSAHRRWPFAELKSNPSQAALPLTRRWMASAEPSFIINKNLHTDTCSIKY
jgi:hypothetical protein